MLGLLDYEIWAIFNTKKVFMAGAASSEGK
jgi:hypothetical protein